MKKNYTYGIIGSGSWATALIKILSENVREINWYVRNSENIDFIKTNSHNPNYLSSAEKLMEYQSLYFEDELIQKDIEDIKIYKTKDKIKVFQDLKLIEEQWID